MSKKNSFHVGDVVKYRATTQPVTAVVIEDRGNIGLRGVRMFRIRYAHEEPFFMETEVPAEELELLERPKRAKSRS